MTNIQTSYVSASTHRIINSRYPSVGVFETLNGLQPEDIDVAFQLEMATNPRLQSFTDIVSVIPTEEWSTGDTSSWVMAAFCHPGLEGARFNDSRAGAWYCAKNVETAIQETIYHNTKRLRHSEGGFPNQMTVRELVADISCDLIDLRGQRASRSDLYDPDSYVSSQTFANQHRWQNGFERGHNGVVFDSVRDPGGINYCLWWPKELHLPVRQGSHYQYNWDASGNCEVAAITML